MRKMFEVRYITYTGECASELFDFDTHDVVMMGDRENLIVVVDDERSIVLGVPVNKIESIRTIEEE